MIKINNCEIRPTVFPDKTSQIWHIPEKPLSMFKDHKFQRVFWDFQYEAEFLQIAQIKTLLDSLGTPAILHLYYLPYGRQDKDVSNDATFALHTFANLLNSLKFDTVAICDPHSDKALELINNSYDYYPYTQLEEVIKETDSNIVCYPDAGALKKYQKHYPYLYIYGVKKRNQETGNIESYELCGECEGKNVMIVDDICDGGATFVNLASKLKEGGASSINLFVSHGIFSKGLKPLKAAGISRIFDKYGEAVAVDAMTVGHKV